METNQVTANPDWSNAYLAAQLTDMYFLLYNSGIMNNEEVKMLREAAKRLTELSTYEGRQNVHAA